MLKLIQIRYNLQQRQDLVNGNAEEQMKVYMNGELEEMKRARFMDAFDPLAHIPKAMTVVKRKVTVTQQGIWILENIDAEEHQNAQESVEVDLTNQNRNNGHWHTRSKLTLLQEIKRECQRTFQGYWAAQLSQGHAIATISNPFSNEWLRTDELHPRAYKFAVKA